MEGYRAGVILCMPEFDTYHALERFARNPSDGAAIQAYLFLRKRTERMIRWRALQELDRFGIQKAIDIYTGTRSHKAPKTLADMTEEQRQELFTKACAAAGVQIDPSLFKN